ncbi:MAG: PPC domain-containing protein [Cyanobacteria bacterium Co-bin8]|nr:PPC domain-containing protein [Cyanobacteria bacterium Co-bin8]
MQGTLLLRRLCIFPATLAAVTLTSVAVRAEIYSPIALPNSREITDTLSEKDIPTGFGGFARDYTVYLESGDQVAIDLISDQFDTLVTLMNKDGSTVGENDDGPDGTTNSLLFARINESGMYTVRVRSYAGQGTGQFQLKVARLREVQ